MNLAKSTVLRYLSLICLLLSFGFGVATFVFIIFEFEKRYQLISSIGLMSYFILFFFIILLANHQRNKEDLEIIKELDEEIRKADKNGN